MSYLFLSCTKLNELKIEDQLVYAYVKEFDIIQRYLIGELIELID